MRIAILSAFMAAISISAPQAEDRNPAPETTNTPLDNECIFGDRNLKAFCEPHAISREEAIERSENGVVIVYGAYFSKLHAASVSRAMTNNRLPSTSGLAADSFEIPSDRAAVFFLGKDLFAELGETYEAKELMTLAGAMYNKANELGRLQPE